MYLFNHMLKILIHISFMKEDSGDLKETGLG